MRRRSLLLPVFSSFFLGFWLFLAVQLCTRKAINHDKTFFCFFRTLPFFFRFLPIFHQLFKSYGEPEAAAQNWAKDTMLLKWEKSAIWEVALGRAGSGLFFFTRFGFRAFISGLVLVKKIFSSGLFIWVQIFTKNYTFFGLNSPK